MKPKKGAPRKMGRTVGVKETIMTKSSLSEFVEVCSGLTNEQRMAVREVGFGELLLTKCTRVRRELCAQVVCNMDTATWMVSFGGCEPSCMTEDDVEELLGLPRGAKEIQLMDTNNDDSQIKIHRSIVKDRIKNTQEASDDFKRDFILYAYSLVLCPNSKAELVRTIEHYINDLSAIRSYNWSKHVLDNLRQSIYDVKYNNKSYLTGSVLFLMIFCMERICKRSKLSAIRPLQYWTNKAITDRLSQWKKNRETFIFADVRPLSSASCPRVRSRDDSRAPTAAAFPTSHVHPSTSASRPFMRPRDDSSTPTAVELVQRMTENWARIKKGTHKVNEWTKKINIWTQNHENDMALLRDLVCPKSEQPVGHTASSSHGVHEVGLAPSPNAATVSAGVQPLHLGHVQSAAMPPTVDGVHNPTSVEGEGSPTSREKADTPLVHEMVDTSTAAERVHTAHVVEMEDAPYRVDREDTPSHGREKDVTAAKKAKHERAITLTGGECSMFVSIYMEEKKCG